MKLKLPAKVSRIINKLTENGFEAYAVGGCVRDSLLGRVPDDWDITTSAKPSQVKDLFQRTADTGISHGTITVILGEDGYEITTYRIDGEYEDCRHPKEVLFTSNLDEDLKRRDFTINAMAYNEAEGLIDLFGGILDLKHKKIRCVGIPGERFAEDALRILRAVRFSAQLGFDIEEKTVKAMENAAPTLSAISSERIQMELVKLMISDHPELIRTVYETGLTAVFLPEFDRMMETEQKNRNHSYSVGEHTIHALNFTESDKILRLSVLFHDIAKPYVKVTREDGEDHFPGHAKQGRAIAEHILKRLKFDKETISQVGRLVAGHGVHPECSSKEVRHAVYKIGEDIFPLLLKVQYADIMAQNSYQREKKRKHLEEIKNLYLRILEDRDCISLKMLVVSGKDLITAGMKPGKSMGEILNALLDEVLDYPDRNNKEYLLERAIKKAQKC